MPSALVGALLSLHSLAYNTKVSHHRHRALLLRTVAYRKALPGVVSIAQRHHDGRERRRGADPCGGQHGALNARRNLVKV